MYFMFFEFFKKNIYFCILMVDLTVHLNTLIMLELGKIKIVIVNIYRPMGKSGHIRRNLFIRFFCMNRHFHLHKFEQTVCTTTPTPDYIVCAMHTILPVRYSTNSIEQTFLHRFIWRLHCLCTICATFEQKSVH